ncbi:MAG: hypothetical protein RIT81_16835 [Deltaproteobacteria bacterium]
MRRWVGFVALLALMSCARLCKRGDGQGAREEKRPGTLGIGVMGQSWANDQANHFPRITDEASYGLQEALRGDLFPLDNRHSGQIEERIGPPLIHNLWSLHLDADPDSKRPPAVSVWAAEGGARLDQIDCRDDEGAFKPSPVCQGMLDNAATAVRLAGVERIPVVFYLQGYADILKLGDPEVWCEGLERLRADLETHWRRIPGYDDGGEALAMIIMGEQRWVRAGTIDETPFSNAMVACAERLPHVYLGANQGAHVPVNPVDNLHNSGTGQIIMAGGMARAGYEVVFGSGSWTPLLMQSCRLVTEQDVDCTFFVPCRAYGSDERGSPDGCRFDPPIVRDVVATDPQPQDGFRVYGDFDTPRIEAVTAEPCDAGVECRLRLKLDRTPSDRAWVGVADKGDAGPYGTGRTYPGCNWRSPFKRFPSVDASWAMGNVDDAGLPLGDQWCWPVSRHLRGASPRDASVEELAALRDGGLLPYANCYATRDGTVTIGGGWNNPSGPGLSGLEKATVMMHTAIPRFDHVLLFEQAGVIRAEMKGARVVVSVFDDGEWRTASASNVPLNDAQWVFVYDGTQPSNADRVTIYRWPKVSSRGLEDVGVADDREVPFPRRLSTSSAPFVYGGYKVHAFAAWETALPWAAVRSLNHGRGVVDPRNASIPPDVYFPAEELPGTRTLTDLSQGFPGALSESAKQAPTGRCAAP